ncbi:ATP-binding cassette transporter snq2 [Emydomyces testavorans]|uniref:ATP-binding cassette transporter snq2 n=1 Tax=Emydomyces testavorans TaxID=2070801 RepID=A0AAF0IJM6_9EURO|nr:ATP-binding cassette transporter snq2 [Emydomyces testavorans]
MSSTPETSSESKEPISKVSIQGLDTVRTFIKKQSGSGIHLKHVPITFRGLSVSAPNNDEVMVKTLPRAILNTFGIDQFTFIKKLLFPGGKAKETSGRRNILKDFAGIVKPGEMLLVLGRPGSGCSTFLRTLANRTSLSVQGDLRYAGSSAADFGRTHRRDTIYLPEEDQHIAALSVRQTLRFALRMSLSRSVRTPEMVEEMVHTMAQMFGIEHALDTSVGGAFFPGISGGERKRVSIAEVLAAGSAVQCFDNSTRGLDSSTALDFVKALRTLTDTGDRTTFATLYQAGENIYNHFDKVIVIYEGRQAFFGRADEAKKYFEDLGFIRTRGQTTAEFLSNVTDPLQRRVSPGSQAANLKTAADFADKFKSSPYFASLNKEMELSHHQNQNHACQTSATASFNLPYALQIWECVLREVQLVKGQRMVHYFKWITTVVLCLVIGSEYFDISNDAQGAFTRGGLLFFALVFNGWLQFPELFDAHTNRPVLERQGFRFGGTASTITILFSGFLVPTKDMRPYFGWLHYVSPVNYAYESVFVNEFDALTLECNGKLIPDLANADPAYQICTLPGAQQGQQSITGQQYAEANGLYLSHKWRNVGILFAFIAAYIVISVLGSEIMRFTSQGGAPIVYTSRRKSRKDQVTPVEKDVEKELSTSGFSGDEKMLPSQHHGPSLTWENLTVDIDGKRIVKGITAYIRPGDFVSICGASGAGKTTMLKALSQINVTGEVRGQMMFGGEPIGKLYKRATGFAQQNDLHDGTSTIREAFEFSALLRQPKIYSRAEKLAYVEHVLDLLDLRHVQDALIGDSNSGLGVEMTKRVTIGVELAARPKMLFADEPTSGLDSEGAANIVRYLRRLAHAGQAIMVTIHQPSTLVFSEFDKVLALSPDGEQL